MTRPLRIYVCGAHSTGKTTLARHISRELGLPLINEVARQVIAEFEISFETLRVDLNRAGDYQREVFRRQIEVEQRYPEGFVSDRSFDNLAYAARHSNVIHELIDDHALRYFERVRESLVFYVRPHRECMQYDGMREQVDWDEINRIDGMLDFILSWQQIPCIGINELNMKDRVRTALSAVRLYKQACGQTVITPRVIPTPKPVNGNGEHHKANGKPVNGTHSKLATTTY
jgi:nicotinamide riboside kinase